MIFAAWDADVTAVQLEVGRHDVDVSRREDGNDEHNLHAVYPFSIPIPLVATASRLPHTSDATPRYPVVFHLFTFVTYVFLFARDEDAVLLLEQCRDRAQIGLLLLTQYRYRNYRRTKLPMYLLAVGTCMTRLANSRDKVLDQIRVHGASPVSTPPMTCVSHTPQRSSCRLT